MSKIRNVEEIYRKIDFFSWNNCYEITDFNYYIKTKSESNFDTTIMYRSSDDSIYELKVRFLNPENLTLSVDHISIQLSCFDVLDVRDDGWCSVNYWVHDPEGENINFYCKEVVILGVIRFL